jgi:large conductance mechanosensitive channel
LAVGVVIGAAFNAVVQALVENFLTPIISLVGGGNKISSLYFMIGKVQINYGDFLNTFISFVIVAFVVYFFVVVPMNKLQQLAQSGKSIDPTTKKCPYCYSEINIKATRCSACTSQLTAKKNNK